MLSENIIRLFINAANKQPQSAAFVQGRTKITYDALLKKIQATAEYFAEKGINKQDKVLVFIPMKAELYVTVLALLHIGACPVFLDEWVSISRLKECLKTVPCKAIVAEKSMLFISRFISPLRKLKKLNSSGSHSVKQIIAPTHTLADDTALVTFTTGSTGTPKAANRTHRFLAAQQLALEPLLTNSFQITLTLLPIVVLLNLSLGKTNVLPKKKIDVRKSSSIRHVVQLLQQHAVESIIASPAITVAIAKAIVQRGISSTIRQVITGGGPVFPDDAKAVIKAFPQVAARVVYGSTEAEPISIINMRDLAVTPAETIQLKGLPVGVLHAEIKIAIIPFTTSPISNQSAAEWQQHTLPIGQSGETVVSGPHVLQAYINNETAQKQNKFFVDDVLWHRTGDEGMLDEMNQLYFRGRCTEVIDYNGHKIYSLIDAWLLKQQVPIQEAAIVLHDKQLVIILNKKNRALQAQILLVLKGTFLESVIIRYLPSIPKDKRHQTKINYEKLRKLLS